MRDKDRDAGRGTRDAEVKGTSEVKSKGEVKSTGKLQNNVTIQQNKLLLSIPPVLQGGSEYNEQGGVLDGLTAMY